jgi:hypothetical protein
MKQSKCKGCGKLFGEDHEGVEVTCKKLQAARAALRVIDTWATFEINTAQPAGSVLNALEVHRACKAALEETK